MNIAVHGGRDAGVTQQFLQDFGLHSALNGAGSVCMAQSVLFPESAHTERSYGNAWQHPKTVFAQLRSKSGYHQVHERALCSGHRPLGVWQ